MSQITTEATLRNHVHLAWRDNDIVVLDVSSDAYALLLDGAAAILPTADPGRILISPDLLSMLASLGLTSDLASPARFPIPRAEGDLQVCRQASWWAVMNAAFNGAVSTLDFHRRDFPALVAIAQSRSVRSRPSRSLAQSATAFRTAQPWLPFEGDCLQRAYLIHHHLRREGHPAKWVFGVRTWPFLAHCWVQVGTIVVGDSSERVAGFTPIMAV